ncbi:MAG TPA: hypothetical protein VFL80_06410, partial [Thermoanaerobaculia bacterium]|nr:hypothetical protein [Thermoanaerobaculia bacterium]
NYLYVLMGARGEPYAKLFVVPTLGGGPREIVHDVDSNIALSPDEKSVAFVRPRRNEKESTLVVASIDGSGERVIATRKQPTDLAREGMAWSPDGKWIAIAEISYEGGLGRNILLISPDGKTSKTLLDPRWFFVGRLAWLPDSSGLVGSAQREEAPVSQLWMFPLDGQPRRITNDLNSYSDTSLTADGNALVAVQTDAKSRMWRVRDGAATPITPEGDKSGPNRVGLAADSSFIYDSIVSGNLEVWRQMPNGERRQLTTHPKADYNATISADGTRVYFQSERNGPAEFWSMNVEGGEQRSLYRIGADVSISVSPDGKWLAYSHLRAIWRLPTAGGSPTKISEYLSNPPRYSPDGKWLIAGMSPPGVVRRLEVMIMPAEGGTPREIQPPLPVTAIRNSARFTPDGKSIAYVNSVSDVANVWIRPLDGEGKQVTTFTDEADIEDFGWSRDGKDLFVIRNSAVSDVVMISGFH